MANRKREPSDVDRDGKDEERLVGRDKKGRYDGREASLGTEEEEEGLGQATHVQLQLVLDGRARRGG